MNNVLTCVQVDYLTGPYLTDYFSLLGNFMYACCTCRGHNTGNTAYCVLLDCVSFNPRNESFVF